MGIVLVGFVAFILYRLARTMAKPLQALSEGTQAFAAGELSKRLEFHGTTEFASLSHDFNEMAAKIQEFTLSLERKVDSRTNALAETRDQLAKMEKQVALGKLLSGFSHELNTPIGNALTSVSYAKSLLERAAEDGNAGLNEAATVAALQDCLGLSLHSLDRAILLMSRFRQVSAEQQDGPPENFQLDEYLGDYVAQIVNAQGSGKLNLTYQCAPGIVVSTQKKILNLIFEELVDNALFHGYGGGGGAVHVLATKEDGQIRITFGDDGAGLPPNLTHTAFDPFVTGNRNSGKIGLGLHIAFNLVTRHLNGTISLLERPSGTWIEIRFPAPVDQGPINSR